MSTTRGLTPQPDHQPDHDTRDLSGAAVSQTSGPDAVLFSELELPFALVGFAADRADTVTPGTIPPVTLVLRSTQIFPDLSAAPPELEIMGRVVPAGAALRLGET